MKEKISKFNISKYLRDKLEELELTQAELARKMHKLIKSNGLSEEALKTNISKWLKGERYPGTEYLYYLAEALDVSILSILTAGEVCEKYDRRPYTLYAIAKNTNNDFLDEILNQKDKYGDPIIGNTDEYGYNLLDYAIEFENIQLIDALLKKGYLSFYGFSPKTFFCVNYYQDNENFQKLVKLAVKLDNLEIFSSAINRTFPIVEKNPQKAIEFETYALDSEIIKNILSTKDIFNYLTTQYIISLQDFNIINYGIKYPDHFNNIVNDKLAELPRLSASFNILLNTAIQNNMLDIAENLIDIAIKHKKEVLPKIIEIMKAPITIRQGVISINRFEPINIIGYISPENLKLLSNTQLKSKAELLMKEI